MGRSELSGSQIAATEVLMEQRMTLPDLVARVKDIEMRLLLGPPKVELTLEKGEEPGIPDIVNYEKSWREYEERLLKYGKRLIKERGGRY